MKIIAFYFLGLFILAASPFIYDQATRDDSHPFTGAHPDGPSADDYLPENTLPPTFARL